ncbi:helix-hairpin-helix domain-containing protein [Pseudogracilibacillus sp. SO30301A]|uniref:helix-hairpin-helix domain-containing protein n=1 Tax=Pseudogracilibacillus sp. SO30301A TaxID=3098291 RepID=UPI00300DECD0
MIRLIKKYKIIISIVFAIVIGILLMRNQETNELDNLDSEEDQQPIEHLEQESDELIESTIMVDIKGEVEKPGVYEIEQGTRVIDSIDAAGGFTKEADQNQINLAEKVHDEMVLIVPKLGEESTNPSPVVSHQDNEQKIRLNQATKEEIEQLNGIGPAKAQAIIDFREENGMFQQVDDLLQVNGIGEKTLENVKEFIIIP